MSVGFRGRPGSSKGAMPLERDLAFPPCSLQLDPPPEFSGLTNNLSKPLNLPEKEILRIPNSWSPKVRGLEEDGSLSCPSMTVSLRERGLKGHVNLDATHVVLAMEYEESRKSSYGEAAKTYALFQACKKASNQNKLGASSSAISPTIGVQEMPQL
ncbi:hypothetical protein ACFE04_007805 [Oxalis oulophora]